MILEVADIQIAQDQQAPFEIALKHGIEEIISKATGFLDCRVAHSIESPQRYLLMIEWETLEHHTIDFRSSPAFQAWRALVGPYFSQPPAVEHFCLLQ